MPIPETPLTPLSLQILVALLDGELHGYGIIKAVQAQSAGALKPGAGSLYAALDRMVEAGWLAEREVSVRGGEPQRRYSITRLGRAVTRTEVARLSGLLRVARRKLEAEGEA